MTYLFGLLAVALLVGVLWVASIDRPEPYPAFVRRDL